MLGMPKDHAPRNSMTHPGGEREPQRMPRRTLVKVPLLQWYRLPEQEKDE